MLRKSSLLLTSFAILIAVSTASDCPFWDDEAADPLRVIAVKEVLASKGKHYAILDLAKGPASSPREIKSQYRKRATDLHPDKHTPKCQAEATEAFKLLVISFELLMDPAKKARYDERMRRAGSSPRPSS